MTVTRLGVGVAARADPRDVAAWRGVAVPVTVFVCWRLAHGALIAQFGGGLLDSTLRFDGAYYLSIAQFGYVEPEAGFESSVLAFFPLVPWILDAVHAIVGSESAAVLVTSNLLALSAFTAVWAALVAWTGDHGAARRTIIALALVPTSYAFWMLYSDAALVAATGAAAWAASRRRHGLVATAAVVAAAARGPGVVVGCSLALLRVVRRRGIDGWSILWALAAGLGIALVTAVQHVQAGEPLGWARAQAGWDRQLAPPWTPFVSGVRVIVDELPGLTPQVAGDLAAMAGVGLGVWALARLAKAGAVPTEAAVLAGAMWLVSVSTTITMSQTRFALATWPALMIPALWWPRLPLWARTLTLVAAISLSVMFLHRLALGRFTA